MATIKIYQFECYDIRSDQYIKSKRWATADAIDSIPGARKIAATEVAIEEIAVKSDVHGMTEIGFDPRATPGGLQKTVGFGY